MSGRFRCHSCGDYFDLPPDEQEEYEEGYFGPEPDTCDECSRINSSGCDYDDTYDG